VEDIKIRRLGWVGYIIIVEEERIPKRGFLKETSIPQVQWEDQEPDGRMWFKRMHYSC
jgi:hypothetical protein